MKAVKPVFGHDVGGRRPLPGQEWRSRAGAGGAVIAAGALQFAAHRVGDKGKGD